MECERGQDSHSIHEEHRYEDHTLRLEHAAAPRGRAVLAAVALTAGVTWHGTAADSRHSSSQAVTTTAPTVSRLAASTRDSYADVVKVVAPSVVTIRAEGKARFSRTELPDEDLFR